ncbi:30S ribosomal protein S6--L-glutamate ligase [Pseudooceanicola sp. CBS1P-1]|uniref:Probable alpha-L-glutamate ligase n=2 Tax=Paracoccaceae TaxID=31989 RepID=A0A6L7G1K0_9RHOB|nr:30S ribosomal protein S6--L-glutamate ligase [Pseudooceanicola endophyticus]MXN17388.1 30S ribosomal protein S6--L-glutamate ligase [Pseudooceanicola albus]
MTPPLQFGWEEWLSLPELNVPAILAKVDTGARTSALHASDIEVIGHAESPLVRFTLYPVADNDEVKVQCTAPLVDRRDVTSSNGESEQRFVIRTRIEVAGQGWPIEITLTDRSTMASRMLLGRQALLDHITVLPTARRLQAELGYGAYDLPQPEPEPERRGLRIAVLTREDNYTTRRLVEVGKARGHRVDRIDTTRCFMAINTLAPEVYYDGERLPRYDAVIPRIGASITTYGAAVVRQFETLGTYCVNGSEGITASRDKLFAHQLLARAGIGMPDTAFASSPKDTRNLIELVGGAPLIVKLLSSSQGKGVVLAETKKAAESVISAFRGLKANFLVQHFVREAAGEDIRCLVIGGKVVAAMKRKGAEGDFRSNLHQGGSGEPVKITQQERRVAVKAARTFGLNVAGVDLLRAHDGPKVLEVNSSPGFEGMEAVTGKNLPEILYQDIEARLKRNA